MAIFVLLLMTVGTRSVLGGIYLYTEKKKREAIMEWAAAIRETGFSQEAAAEYMAFLDQC